MTEFIKALLLVVVAEMGDKTQLLAMAMASKYKVKQVMTGVLIATILNHALAVAAGTYLSSLIPLDKVKIVAAIAFIIFGLWTLRGDTFDDDGKKHKYGPVVTVTIAFFIAEMGDKTQLMTIAIAAQSHFPVLILLGTTTGMLVADGIGIIGGAWLAKHVPEVYIKWIAGMIFMIFGTITLYNTVPIALITPISIAAYFLVLALATYIVSKKFS